MAKKKEELERKLGQVVVKIGKKQDEVKLVNAALQQLHIEANEVATEIEKLG